MRLEDDVGLPGDEIARVFRMGKDGRGGIVSRGLGSHGSWAHLAELRVDYALFSLGLSNDRLERGQQRSDSQRSQIASGERLNSWKDDLQACLVNRVRIGVRRSDLLGRH